MENIEVIDKDKYNEILSNIKNKIITSNILTKEELDILNDYILSNNVKNKILDETSNAWKKFVESGLLLYLNEYLIDKLGYVIKPLSEDYRNIRPIMVDFNIELEEKKLILRFIKEHYDRESNKILFKCPKGNKSSYIIDCIDKPKFDHVIANIKEYFIKKPYYCTLCYINPVEEILNEYKRQPE
jgi:hypothetical protein